MVILHLETSATSCSVAISENDNCLFYKADNQGRNHAALLSLFIEEGLTRLRSEGIELSAVAVSSGPGSYTGLRIGVSTAKGICYALGIPLISINTLELIALQAVEKSPDSRNALFVPMIDARRMEVYDAIYDAELTTLRPAQAEILHPESFNSYLDTHTVCFSEMVLLSSVKFWNMITHTSWKILFPMHFPWLRWLQKSTRRNSSRMSLISNLST